MRDWNYETTKTRQSHEEIPSERESEKGQGQGQHQQGQHNHHNQDEGDEDSNGEDGKKRGKNDPVFCHLGDLSNLDLIYKLALNLARISRCHSNSRSNDNHCHQHQHHYHNSSNRNVKNKADDGGGSGERSGGGGGVGSSLLCLREGQIGIGPEWSRSGLAAIRAWSIGHCLMGLMATGLVSNLKARIAENPGAR